MTFGQALKATYAGSIAFLVACPLLALFPVLFEVLQHAIEVHIGMYDSIAVAKAVEHDPLRMGLGILIPAAFAFAVLPSAMAWHGVLAAAIGGALVAWIARRRLGGHTGDVFGAAEQVAECAVLLALSAVAAT